MAVRPVTAQEVPEEREAFVAAWEIVKRHARIRQGDPAWPDVVRELDELGQKWPGSPCGVLASGLALAVADYLAARSKATPTSGGGPCGHHPGR